MDRLSVILTLMTGAVITGAFTAAAFIVGFYHWLAVVVAASIGIIACWPIAYWISRRIKRDDPHWRHRDPASPKVKTGISAPEV